VSAETLLSVIQKWIKFDTFFVKLLLNTRKKKIIIRKQKITKRIIFALFFLQKVKFEEIRKNCSYIIIYHYNYVIIYRCPILNNALRFLENGRYKKIFQIKVVWFEGRPLI